MSDNTAGRPRRGSWWSGLGLAGGLALAAMVPGRAAAGDACCQPAPATGAASRNSLYQWEGRFTDDAGRPCTLASFRGRPVVLAMFFSSCGYACPLTVSDLLAIQARLPADVRGRAAIVLVTFDVARDTPEVLARFRTQRGLDGQWTLLHGTDDDVRELAALLGVKYQQQADGTFAHSNVLTVLNAEGEIVHQRPGLQSGLDEVVRALTSVNPARP